jgi:ribosome maturation factor RimP
MAKLDALETQIEEHLKELGFDLVETKKFQNGQQATLRVTISDPKKHVGHEQCASVSKVLKRLLDEHELNWNLEVWSPGIGRELKTERDFAIFTGKLVEISFEGELKEIGELKGKNANEVKITVNDEEQTFEMSSLKKVVLAHDTRPVAGENELVEISVEDI